MEEGSGATLIDATAFGNDAAITGSPTWVAGRVGQALDLSGTGQYAIAPDSSSLDISTAITLAAWIKPEKVATQNIMKKTVGTTTPNGYELSLSSAGYVFIRMNGSATYRLDSNIVYPTDGTTWMHVAATYDGATITVYINGVLNTSKAVTPVAIGVNTTNLGIGAEPATTVINLYQGALDDARIYNRALNLAEIQVLAGTTPTATLTVSRTGTGSGTITSDPAGINCGTDCLENYPLNTVVTLSAAANPGSTFTGWSGEGCTSTGSCVVTMDAAKAVSANFTLVEYTLAVTSAHGTVTKNPDQATYHYGDLVQLSVIPTAGYTFTGWSGDASGTTNPVSVLIDGNKSVTANYSQNEYTLAITSAHGTVAKTPDQATYHYGETVQLTATPDAGYTFSNWSGDAGGTANPVSVLMDGNKSVTANYAAITYLLQVNKTGSGSGTVTSAPAGISCGTTCSYLYSLNTIVTLTAVQDAGSTFTGWSGAGCTGTGTCVVTMSAAQTASAEFTLIPVPTGLTCTNLASKPATASTGEKPQSKVWTYNGAWYAVFPTNTSGASSAGTWLWRLVGTTWTEQLKLSDRTDTKADVKVSGSLVHILLYADSNTQSITAEFISGAYQLWITQPGLVNLSLPGSEIATIDKDSTGKLWVASRTSAGEVVVYHSNSPYSVWNGPIVLATGVIGNDDLEVVIALPNGSIGVFWSNQNTARFGFRVHVDGTDPVTWSADESPASQSAIPGVGTGMADDHMNLAVASDSTLYAAVKTGYDTAGYPKMALLVRRPSGTWDNLYGVDEAGTRPIILLDEVHGFLTMIYTSSEGYNPIVYRQSATSNISFTSRSTLRAGSFNDVSSMKTNYTSEFVVIYASSTEIAGQICAPTATNGADLSITKTDGLTSVRPNGQLTYTITAANTGPQAATGATINDTLPTSLINVNWTCTGTGGGVCTASGTGNINDTVTLPVGSSVTYTVHAVVDLGARGIITNTAAISVPGGLTDPILSNNSSTDTDTILIDVATCESDPTLVGCWQMEENTGTTLIDGSSYFNDAALYGAPAWQTGFVGSYAMDLMEHRNTAWFRMIIHWT